MLWGVEAAGQLAGKAAGRSTSSVAYADALHASAARLLDKNTASHAIAEQRLLLVIL
jgi:hypothetical protein